MEESSFQQLADKQYKEFFDMADEARKCVDSLLTQFNDHGKKLFDLSPCRRIFLFILTRSIKTYSSIVALCRMGYGQDASALLRSLLENLVTAEFILSDPENADTLARRFVAYKWIIFKRVLPEQEKQIQTASETERQEFYKRQEMIMQHVDDFKKEFHITSDRALLTWSGKTVRDMAKHVSHELLAEYDRTFRQCSKFSHPSILGDQEYIVQDDMNLVFSPLPSPIGILINLNQAVKYFLDFAMLINDQFNLNHKETIDQLRLRHQEMVKKRPSQEPAVSETPKEAIPIRECTVVFKLKK